MGPYSLAWTLDLIRPRLPDRVAQPRAWLKVRAAATRLPAAMTTCIYFESWLHGAVSRLDFTIRVEEAGAAMLDGVAPRAWQTVIKGDVALWLEFDVDEATEDACLAGAVTPRLFVDFGSRSSPSSVGDALEVLRGASLPRVVTRRLQIVFESLPSGAAIPYAGLSHGGEAVRVCVAGLKEMLPTYLQTVGWPDDVDRLAQTVLAPIAAPFGLIHFDVASDVLAPIGVEYPAALVLPYLVERGFCDAGVRDELLAWPGQTIEEFPHHVWCSRLIRRLNHVKVVYERGRVRAVKAYLCCVDRPLVSGVAAARLANRASFPAAGRYSVDGEFAQADDRDHVGLA